jgi:hypothetical protein
VCAGVYLRAAQPLAVPDEGGNQHAHPMREAISMPATRST